MVFHSITCNENGEVKAVAQGHADDVLSHFRMVCMALLNGRGAWRITSVHGQIADHTVLDSDMSWVLEAKVK
jgi:hypothetical protein